jgi:hypothetical protein
MTAPRLTPLVVTSTPQVRRTMRPPRAGQDGSHASGGASETVNSAATVTYVVVELPEPELRWRRQQILRLLADILRKPDPAERHRP